MAQLLTVSYIKIFIINLIVKFILSNLTRDSIISLDRTLYGPLRTSDRVWSAHDIANVACANMNSAARARKLCA